MCGENSVSVVETVSGSGNDAFGVTPTKLLFVVYEDGSIGTSHSETRRLAKLPGNARYVNAMFQKARISYDEGDNLPSWYGKLQPKTEAALLALEKKMEVAGKAYARKVATAHRVHDKALIAASKLTTAKARAAAEKKANAAFEASKKAAFATIAKLGGIAQ
jgi:hypothetical protein